MESSKVNKSPLNTKFLHPWDAHLTSCGVVANVAFRCSHNTQPYLKQNVYPHDAWICVNVYSINFTSLHRNFCTSPHRPHIKDEHTFFPKQNYLRLKQLRKTVYILYCGYNSYSTIAKTDVLFTSVHLVTNTQLCQISSSAAGNKMWLSSLTVYSCCRARGN